MGNEITLQILPGVTLVVDETKFTVEANLSLGGLLIEGNGADIKVYIDVRLVDVISKEQSKAESLVILRTK